MAAVHFQLPESTNYSTKFLSCRRAPSPYPGRERQKSTSKAWSKHMFRKPAYFKVIKQFLAKKHHDPSDKFATSTLSHKSADERQVAREAAEKANVDYSVARRNAMDLDSRPPFPPYLFNDSDSTLFERELYRLPVDPGHRIKAGDSIRENSIAHAGEVPGTEDSAVESPFREDIRTFGSVLAWMHSEGVNVAGYETTEMERRECEEGRCRCLGPLARDV